MSATTISQALRAALEALPGVAVHSGKSAEWISKPEYPVICIEPRTERIERIVPPKVKYARIWAIEILTDQEDPEPALTSLLRECFEALSIADQNPQLAGARLSVGDVSFTLFIEQSPQSSAVFQLTASFVE